MSTWGVIVMEPDHGEDLCRQARISVLYIQSGSVDAAAH